MGSESLGQKKPAKVERTKSDVDALLRGTDFQWQTEDPGYDIGSGKEFAGRFSSKAVDKLRGWTGMPGMPQIYIKLNGAQMAAIGLRSERWTMKTNTPMHAVAKRFAGKDLTPDTLKSLSNAMYEACLDHLFSGDELAAERGKSAADRAKERDQQRQIITKQQDRAKLLAQKIKAHPRFDKSTELQKMHRDLEACVRDIDAVSTAELANDLFSRRIEATLRWAQLALSEAVVGRILKVGKATLWGKGVALTDRLYYDRTIKVVLRKDVGGGPLEPPKHRAGDVIEKDVYKSEYYQSNPSKFGHPDLLDRVVQQLKEDRFIYNYGKPLIQDATFATDTNLSRLHKALYTMKEGSVGYGDAYDEGKRQYVAQAKRFIEIIGNFRSDDEKHSIYFHNDEAGTDFTGMVPGIMQKHINNLMTYMTWSQAIAFLGRLERRVRSDWFRSDALKVHQARAFAYFREALLLKALRERQTGPGSQSDRDMRYRDRCLELAIVFRGRGTVKTPGSMLEPDQYHFGVNSERADQDYSMKMAKQALNFPGLAQAYFEKNTPKEALELVKPAEWSAVRTKLNKRLLAEKKVNLAQLQKAIPGVADMVKLMETSPKNIKEASAQYSVFLSLEAMANGQVLEQSQLIKKVNDKVQPIVNTAFKEFLNQGIKGASVDAVQKATGIRLDNVQIDALKLLNDMAGNGWLDWSDTTWGYVEVGVKIAGYIAVGVVVGTLTAGAGLGVICSAIVGGGAMTGFGAVAEGRGWDTLDEAVKIYGTEFALNTVGMGIGRSLNNLRQALYVGRATGQSARQLFMLSMSARGAKVVGKYYDEAVTFGARLAGLTAESVVDAAATTSVDTIVLGGNFMDHLYRNAMFVGLPYGFEFKGFMKSLKGASRAQLQQLHKTSLDGAARFAALRQATRGTDVSWRSLAKASRKEMLGLTKNLPDDVAKRVRSAWDSVYAFRQEWLGLLKTTLDPKLAKSTGQLSVIETDAPWQKEIADINDPQQILKYLLAHPELDDNDAVRLALLRGTFRAAGYPDIANLIDLNSDLGKRLLKVHDHGDKFIGQIDPTSPEAKTKARMLGKLFKELGLDADERRYLSKRCLDSGLCGKILRGYGVTADLKLKAANGTTDIPAGDYTVVQNGAIYQLVNVRTGTKFTVTKQTAERVRQLKLKEIPIDESPSGPPKPNITGKKPPPPPGQKQPQYPPAPAPRTPGKQPSDSGPPMLPGKVVPKKPVESQVTPTIRTQPEKGEKIYIKAHRDIKQIAIGGGGKQVEQGTYTVVGTRGAALILQPTDGSPAIQIDRNLIQHENFIFAGKKVGDTVYRLEGNRFTSKSPDPSKSTPQSQKQSASTKPKPKPPPVEAVSSTHRKLKPGEAPPTMKRYPDKGQMVETTVVFEHRDLKLPPGQYKCTEATRDYIVVEYQGQSVHIHIDSVGTKDVLFANKVYTLPDQRVVVYESKKQGKWHTVELPPKALKEVSSPRGEVRITKALSVQTLDGKKTVKLKPGEYEFNYQDSSTGDYIVTMKGDKQVRISPDQIEEAVWYDGQVVGSKPHEMIRYKNRSGEWCEEPVIPEKRIYDRRRESRQALSESPDLELQPTSSRVASTAKTLNEAPPKGYPKALQDVVDKAETYSVAAEIHMSYKESGATTSKASESETAGYTNVQNDVSKKDRAAGGLSVEGRVNTGLKSAPESSFQAYRKKHRPINELVTCDEVKGDDTKKILSYQYYSEDYGDSTGTRKGTVFRLAIVLDTKEADKIFHILQNNPNYLRTFFMGIALNSKINQTESGHTTKNIKDILRHPSAKSDLDTPTRLPPYPDKENNVIFSRKNPTTGEYDAVAKSRQSSKDKWKHNEELEDIIYKEQVKEQNQQELQKLDDASPS